MKTITIHPSDNVAVDVSTGHKVALKDIAAGEDVIKYGFPIGHATSDIKEGEHVHTHNLKTNLHEKLEYVYSHKEFPMPEAEGRTIKAYLRADGNIGIRNDVWIVNTVGCVNKVAEAIAKRTGALFFPHPYGCSQLGGDHRLTQKILRGLIQHPNAGGVLVLGLGCENNNLSVFKKVLGIQEAASEMDAVGNAHASISAECGGTGCGKPKQDSTENTESVKGKYGKTEQDSAGSIGSVKGFCGIDEKRVRFLNAQDCEDEVEEGVRIIKELQAQAALEKRVEVPISKLKVGLKCGGSDGFSGLTANPLIGQFSDYLIAEGGSTVLTEVPEMFGAETILMDRCRDEAAFNKTVALINDFKDYFTKHGQEIYENPSPGNKAGGITTLEEKSLGCTQKGGRAQVVDVLDYGDVVTENGLNLLNGPGNDMVAVTNLTAAGCHLILFSTGRGTPLGAPVPTVKIATNSGLAERKKNWIDFDAGPMINGIDLRQDLIDFVIKVAEGGQTANERNGYREIAIFKDGVTL